MGGLPFTLALSDWFGNTRTVGAFGDVADLWTFYEAWRGGADAETLRRARFVYVGGRAVRHASPMADKATALAWGSECAARG